MGKPKFYRIARAAGQLELFPLIPPAPPFDPDRTRPLPPLPPLPVLEHKLAGVRREVRNLILLQLSEQNPHKKKLLFHLERSARAEVKMRRHRAQPMRTNMGAASEVAVEAARYACGRQALGRPR